MGTVCRGAVANAETGPLVSVLAEGSKHTGAEVAELFLGGGPF